MAESVAYALCLTAISRDARLHLELSFDPNLFAAPAMQARLQELRVIVEQILAKPDRPHQQINCLSQQQQRDLIRLFDAPNPEHAPATIIDLIDRQVERTPDHIAVAFEDDRLTYRQLKQKANRLAHLIRAVYQENTHHTLPAGAPLGLCMKRGMDMLVGVLAILEAGGAYVPIDPDYPAKQINHMLANSGASLVVTQISVVADCAALRPENVAQAPVVLCVDQGREAGMPDHRVAIPRHPESLAYIIYTSGTTGMPKGVAIENRSLVNLARHLEAFYGLTPEDGVVQFAPLTFDMSVEEIFPYLICGARVVMRPDVMPDYAQLLQMITTHKVTVLNLPIVYAAMLAESEPEQARAILSRLRLVAFGGDAFGKDLMAMWRSPGLRLVNAYGPTECSVNASTGYLDDDQIHLGAPVAGMRLYVLNNALDPVPTGALGDLYVAGPGLARGYLGCAGLTARAFLPNPFAGPDDPEHSRMYDTGDRVWVSAAGRMFFAGRKDAQLKVRGYRIEPGAVEHVLGGHPEIGQCVVAIRNLATTSGAAYKSLIAYYVGASAIPTEDLRRFMSGQLPDYMIPEAFVRLDALPLTRHGKLDRAALPEPEVETRAYTPPANPVQCEYCQIWARVLDLEQVGITDDFFRIGGNSIRAIQALNQMNRAGYARVQMIDLFQRRTIQQLTVGASAQEQHRFTGEL